MVFQWWTFIFQMICFAEASVPVGYQAASQYFIKDKQLLVERTSEQRGIMIGTRSDGRRLFQTLGVRLSRRWIDHWLEAVQDESQKLGVNYALLWPKQTDSPVSLLLRAQLGEMSYMHQASSGIVWQGLLVGGFRLQTEFLWMRDLSEVDPERFQLGLQIGWFY